MNYERIYKEFIADRRSKEAGLTGYTEKHHILPRSLKGSDEPENLIRLTPSDHYFAHLLLAKIHGGTQWSALFLMSKKSPTTQRGKVKRALFEIARRNNSEALKANNPAHRPEVIEKQRALALANPTRMFGGANGKAKEVINYTTGQRFTSVAEAAKHYDLSESGLSKAARGQRKTSGGYRWAYV